MKVKVIFKEVIMEKFIELTEKAKKQLKYEQEMFAKAMKKIEEKQKAHRELFDKKVKR